MDGELEIFPFGGGAFRVGANGWKYGDKYVWRSGAKFTSAAQDEVEIVVPSGKTSVHLRGAIRRACKARGIKAFHITRVLTTTESVTTRYEVR